jgi:hypothetical protein
MTTFTEEKVHTEHNQSNGHNSAFQQDANARAYILALKAHEKPLSMPDVGKWWQCCNIIKASLEHNPTHIEIVIRDLYGSYPGLKELLADDWGQDPLQGETSTG